MGGFRNTDVGGDKLSPHLVKTEVDKGVLIRIAKDDISKWNEIWPTFPGQSEGGNKLLRKFVLNEDGSNIKALNDFRKNNNLDKILGGDKRAISNWNSKLQFAVPVIIGVEQIVKNDAGKKVRKIVWDYTAKVYKFGIKAFRSLQSINHNPTLIEQAENHEKQFKMADPDDPSSEGHNCTDVFAIRVTKKSLKGQISYDIQADKLIGPVKRDKVESLDEIVKLIEQSCKPSTETEVERFINFATGSDESNEPESEEETIDVDEKPAKKLVKKEEDDEDSIKEDEDDEKPVASKKSVKKDDEEESIEEDDDKPTKSAKKSKDEDEIDIDADDLPDIDEE